MKLALSSLIACLVLQVAASAAEVSPMAKTDQTAIVEGNNTFAVELYAHLRDQSGNLFFSPASVSTALAMTYAGARGETAAQMAGTLHFTLPPKQLHPAMGALLDGFNAAHNGYELRVANALWAQQSYIFLDSFLNLNKSDYGAGFHRVDFKTATEAARLTINQWTEQQTNDKINNLLRPGVLKPDTKLVLTNAIYFKGEWQATFQKDETSNEVFHLSSSQTVKTPLMNRSGNYNYFNGGSFQILEMPYKSNELSMIVFLPGEVNGLAALEKSLTAASTRQWFGKFRPVPEVIVTIPKFKVTQQIDLAATLSAMGMPLAFDKFTADFSAMTGNPDLFISAVIHKAFIDVNEAGTEAAAATAVVMMETMALPPRPHAQPLVFRADHPFLYLIRDNHSGSILFMGRVTDPTK